MIPAYRLLMVEEPVFLIPNSQMMNLRYPACVHAYVRWFTVRPLFPFTWLGAAPLSLNRALVSWFAASWVGVTFSTFCMAVKSTSPVAAPRNSSETLVAETPIIRLDSYMSVAG